MIRNLLGRAVEAALVPVALPIWVSFAVPLFVAGLPIDFHEMLLELEDDLL